MRAIIVDLRRAAGQRGRERKIAIAAKREGIEPPTGPASELLTTVGDGQIIGLAGGDAQLLPVDLEPAGDILAGVYER
jgi:hypothetical protein